MAERRLTPPCLVEVVSAESVDDVVAGMAADLAMLEGQLAQLNATAAALERRVKEVGWAARDDAAAGPLLRRVFEHQTAAARAAMAAALDQAVLEAEEHVAAARVEAESLIASRPQMDGRTFGTAAPEATPAADPSLHAESKRGSEPPVAEAPRRHAEPDPPAAPDTFVQPSQWQGAMVSADEPTTAMPVVTVDDPRPVELTDEASTAFGEFWVADNAVASSSGVPSAILDATLPLVALLIIVVVVLSWIG